MQPVLKISEGKVFIQRLPRIIQGVKKLITINHCKKCDNDFMIPEEFFDGLNTTMFVCPECHSHNWKKLSDMSIMKK